MATWEHDNEWAWPDEYSRDMLWKTREGQLVRIRDMEDSHLLNAERFLRSDGATQPRSRAGVEVLQEELRIRGLKPLPAHPSSDTAYFERGRAAMAARDD